MPDIDDFYAFKSTSGGGGSGGGEPGCFTLIFIGLGILWLIGKLFG